jgi:hypothetical protein
VITGRAQPAFAWVARLVVALLASMGCLAPSAATTFRHFSPHAHLSQLTQAQTPINGVKHFGYPVLASISGLGTPDFAMLPEIRRHTNVVGAWYDPSNPTSLLPLIEQLGPDFKGVIFVQKIFIKASGEAYSPSEIATRLNAFKNVFLSRRTHILYFGFDETLLARQTHYCGQLPSCTFGPLHRLINSEAVPDLEKWMFDVRTALPGPGTLVIESGNMIQASLHLPVNADVYGINCYRPLDDCHGESLQTRFGRLKDKVNELNRFLSGHRRLSVIPESMIVIQRQGAAPTPDTATSPLTVSTASDDAGVEALLESYRAFWEAEPMVTLVAPFMWSLMDGGDLSTMIIGARGLPRARAWLESLGHAITGKPRRPWQGPPVVQFLLHPVIRVGEHSVWTWAATGATRCRSVSEPTNYQNLTTSGVVILHERQARQGVYTMACDGPGGTTVRSVAVQVVATPAAKTTAGIMAEATAETTASSKRWRGGTDTPDRP